MGSTQAPLLRRLGRVELHGRHQGPVCRGAEPGHPPAHPEQPHVPASHSGCCLSLLPGGGLCLRLHHVLLHGRDRLLSGPLPAAPEHQECCVRLKSVVEQPILELHKELLGSLGKSLHGYVLPLRSLAGALASLGSCTLQVLLFGGGTPRSRGGAWSVGAVPGALSCCWKGTG